MELQSAGSLASGQEALSEGNSLSPFPFPVLGGNSCVWWMEPLEPVFTLGLGMGGAIHRGLSHMLSSDPHINNIGQGLGKVNSERQKPQPGEGK